MIEPKKMSKRFNLSIDRLIQDGNIEALTDILNRLSPIELSEIISKKSEQDQSLLFGVLVSKLAIQTFDFLPLHVQKSLLHTMPSSQIAALLVSLAPDDRTSFLQGLPKSVVDELLKLLPLAERLEAMSLLNYPQGSVGRLMTPDYITVKLDWTIEKVLDYIQAYGHDSETIDVIYVIDDTGKLLDDIKLKDFLFVPRSQVVQSIADYKVTALFVYDSDEAAINVFRQQNRVALPVINDQGLMLGIVTFDDILRLSDQEMTEDMQKIGGMEALDEPYMQSPFFELMKKRAGWLVILFVGEMFTATAMGYFQDEIAKAVVLALFLPLIISSGGNAGSQASTLVIRALALGEIKLLDWFRVVKREFSSGLFLGTILGFIGFLRVSLWSVFTDIYGQHWLLIALTVFCALIGVVLWGTLAGAVLPLILKRIGMDPATSSAPCVATIVDVTGLIIYFMIAMCLLNGTLL